LPRENLATAHLVLEADFGESSSARLAHF
jgi:hypothetical protein